MNTERNRLLLENPKLTRKISVIIPCYNQGKYIKAAVNSVINQNYDNYEIIIVDDGSNDKKTPAILDRIKHANIKIYHIENSGVCYARNFGYSKSTGQYIQFLDADDMLMPDKFNTQIGVMISNDSVGVCYADYNYYHESESEYRKPSLKVNLGEDYLESIVYGWQRRFSVPIHSPLFDRRVFLNDDPFRADLKVAEDWVMWTAVAKTKFKFYFVDQIFATYRIWHLSNTNSKNSIDSRLYWASRAVSYIADHYIEDNELNRFNEEQAKYLKFLARMYFSDEFSEGFRLNYLEVLSKLNKLENSISWKLTRPLRLFKLYILESIKKGAIRTAKKTVKKTVVAVCEYGLNLVGGDV